MAFSPQLDLEALGAAAAFMVVENGEYLHFQGRFTGFHRPRRLRVLPSIVAAGYLIQHLAWLLNVVINALLINEMKLVNGIGGGEAMCF